MAVFAIGDLHFSPKDAKLMDIFGWGNHKEKIIANWMEQVSWEDIVIVAGDISWALKYEEAGENLELIQGLPGKKILLKGNHDYWWQSMTKMKKDYPDLFFLHNNSFVNEDVVIFGTRGWVAPSSNEFTLEDQKIFDRELGRLDLSFGSFLEERGSRQVIVAMHYPPVNEKQEPSEVTRRMEKHGVDYMLYGHLHGAEAFKRLYQGLHQGTQYHLVSADYLDFKLKKIID